MRAKHPERAKRLRDFLNRLKINNITLASKLGIKPAFISQLLNKHSTVTANMALRIAHVYPTLNINWLLNGTGEMLIEKKEGESDILSVVSEAESPPYNRRPGEGRLEWLERSLTDALEGRLKTQEELREALEKMNALLREQKALLERVKALEDEVRKGKV